MSWVCTGDCSSRRGREDLQLGETEVILLEAGWERVGR